MYVVVETDPASGESHVLFPRSSMIQVHQTLEDAERHRAWYIDNVYLEDPALGAESVRIYRLKPVEAGLPFLPDIFAAERPCPP